QRHVGAANADRVPATLDGTVHTIVELSRRDMYRRKFLLGSVFSAGAYLGRHSLAQRYLGRCLTDLGDPDHGSTLTSTALRGYEPWRVRARYFAQTDLARAHLLRRDPDQAAAAGRDALRTAAEISSHRVLERLRTLQRQVAPLRSASPPLADLDERITGFLTRSTRQRQQDNNL
ncbi:MAG TPA: hypothetical protein VHH34_02070, partial [Pseudonocardiaceae bacterium]|nr:hypothetical protein [Pseudonocardiaceae bacterium]